MMSEDAIIARHLAPVAGPGSLTLLDDAAVLSPPPGHDLVLTKDALVAGVHFFAEDPPGAIARKALRVNLSDLAAKGATPAGFLLALALPAGLTEDWIADFAAALGEDARAYGCPLLGGDTVRASGGLTLSVTALGYCPTGAMVHRTTAKPGMRLAVTGTVGDAALGLQLRLQPDAPWARALSAPARAHLAERYLLPRPRNALAEAIRAHAAAAMDVSDGLLGDAVKLAAAARAHAVIASPAIDLARLPLSPAACEALAIEPALLETIATGGDDYEVLMAVTEASWPALQAAVAAEGQQVTLIGAVIAGEKADFRGRDGLPVDFGRLKFEHAFRA
jgi:thiamine-monophosphate kinase